VSQVSVHPELTYVTEQAPFLGDADFGRRYRHLGEAAGDERGEHYAERRPVLIVDRTSEHDPQAAPNSFRPCREAGVGRLGAEAMPALGENYLLSEAASQDEEIRRFAVVGDASFETPYGVHSQRSRYEKTPRFEVEGCIQRYSDLLVKVLLARVP
jgi:hypothetical protein